MKKTKKGFTLVELLVVIAILAILATVSVVGYTSFIDKANMSNAQVEADQIKTIVNSGLMANEYVKLTDEIYAKNDSTFVSSCGDSTSVFDATDDIATLVGENLGTLKIDSGKLIYTRYGYNVNVMTREANKAS